MPWKQCILGNVVFLHRLSDSQQQTAYLIAKQKSNNKVKQVWISAENQVNMY